MKAFSFPLLCSHQSKPSTHPLDYHRSSFLFCFSPHVPIQSIFISPLSSLYRCFHFNPISIFPNPYSTCFSPFSAALWQALSHVLHLSVIFPPLFQPSVLYFPCDCSLPRLFLFYWHISSFSIFTSALSDALSPHSPFLAKPSTDQLSSPAWCLFQTYTLRPTGQFKWFKGGRRHTYTHKTDLTVWPWNILEFQSMFTICDSPSFPERFPDLQRTISIHTLR